MRTIVCMLGLAFAAGAAVLAALRCFAPAGILAVWAAIFLGGIAVERWRYKKLLGALPPGPGWQATEERFIDPETSRWVTVYFHSTTGERRYVAVP
jgi:hypothetical protein